MAWIIPQCYVSFAVWATVHCTWWTGPFRVGSAGCNVGGHAGGGRFDNLRKNVCSAHTWGPTLADCRPTMPTSLLIPCPAYQLRRVGYTWEPGERATRCEHSPTSQAWAESGLSWCTTGFPFDRKRPLLQVCDPPQPQRPTVVNSSDDIKSRKVHSFPVWEESALKVIYFVKEVSWMQEANCLVLALRIKFACNTGHVLFNSLPHSQERVMDFCYYQTGRSLQDLTMWPSASQARMASRLIIWKPQILLSCKTPARCPPWPQMSDDVLLKQQLAVEGNSYMGGVMSSSNCRNALL